MTLRKLNNFPTTSASERLPNTDFTCPNCDALLPSPFKGKEGRQLLQTTSRVILRCLRCHLPLSVTPTSVQVYRPPVTINSPAKPKPSSRLRALASDGLAPLKLRVSSALNRLRRLVPPPTRKNSSAEPTSSYAKLSSTLHIEDFGPLREEATVEELATQNWIKRRASHFTPEEREAYLPGLKKVTPLRNKSMVQTNLVEVKDLIPGKHTIKKRPLVVRMLSRKRKLAQVTSKGINVGPSRIRKWLRRGKKGLLWGIPAAAIGIALERTSRSREQERAMKRFALRDIPERFTLLNDTVTYSKPSWLHQSQSGLPLTTEGRVEIRPFLANWAKARRTATLRSRGRRLLGHLKTGTTTTMAKMGKAGGSALLVLGAATVLNKIHEAWRRRANRRGYRVPTLKFDVEDVLSEMPGYEREAKEGVILYALYKYPEILDASSVQRIAHPRLQAAKQSTLNALGKAKTPALLGLGFYLLGLITAELSNRGFAQPRAEQNVNIRHFKEPYDGTNN